MSSSPHLPVPWLRSFTGALLIAASSAGLAAPPESPAAQTLRATHQRLSDRLEHSSFGRPVQIDSVETADGLQGDVYALVDHPLQEISSTLKGSAHWCLHTRHLSLIPPARRP